VYQTAIIVHDFNAAPHYKRAPSHDPNHTMPIKPKRRN